MIAQQDQELWLWLEGVAHPRSGAGDFLRSLVDAALRADGFNYTILRPALLNIAKKYPRYQALGQKLLNGEGATTSGG